MLNLKALYKDICLGYSKLDLEDKTHYIKHLSPLDLAEVDDIYNDGLSRALNNGLESRDSKIKRARENGKWDDIKEKSLESYMSDIRRLYDSRNTIESRNHLKVLNEEIKTLETLYYDLHQEKAQITNNCAEDFADNIAGQHQVFISLYKDEKLTEHSFSKDEFDYLSQSEYMDILLKSRKVINEFTIENIKRIACSIFFQESFSLIEQPVMFFNKPIYLLSYYQTKLLKLGMNFKIMISEIKNLPEEDYENPAKIEELFYLTRSGAQNESREAKKGENKFRSLLDKK